MNGPKTSRTLRTKKLFREIYLFLFNDLLVICRQIPGWVQNLGSTQDTSLVLLPQVYPTCDAVTPSCPSGTGTSLGLTCTPPSSSHLTFEHSWLFVGGTALSSWKFMANRSLTDPRADLPTKWLCIQQFLQGGSELHWLVSWPWRPVFLSRSDFWLIASWRTAQI